MIDELISGGHDADKVLTYSMPKAVVFLRLVIRRKKLELLGIAGAVRTGFHADKDGWARYVKHMER